MNNLVAYDSSSGDESSPVKATVSAEPKKVLAKEVNTGNGIPSSLMVNDRPMVGPSVPSGVVQGYDEYEEELPTSPQDSERDMVRYLTQPSHPMTEMPSSPPGSPNTSTAARIKHFLDLKAKGTHFNQDLAQKSAFKNPSLLQSLVIRVDIDSSALYSTSLPLDVFDPLSFPPAGYKESLLKSQQAIRVKEDAEKKALGNAGKRVIEFTSDGTLTPTSVVSSPGNLYKRQRK